MRPTRKCLEAALPLGWTGERRGAAQGPNKAATPTSPQDLGGERLAVLCSQPELKRKPLRAKFWGLEFPFLRAVLP